MDHVYAFGVTCIQLIQHNFEGYDSFFTSVNHLADPHHGLDMLFPMVSAIDSVFAAQALLSMAVGEWLNAILKWIFAEDRPYWWVKETTYYTSDILRPDLRQLNQTCETGPGCPSGHSMFAATGAVLLAMWITHLQHDRKMKLSWYKYIVWPLCTMSVVMVMLARLYIATHFPHQCILGSLCGLFLPPVLCIYIIDPFVWDLKKKINTNSRIFLHILLALSTIIISFAMYWGMKLFGIDPLWSIKLAFKWCADVHYINVTTTPMYSLVESTASIVGWACCVTPAVAKFRHYTKARALWMSIPLTIFSQYLFKTLQTNIDSNDVTMFYLKVFFLYFVKPIVFLRLIPFASMIPYAVLDKKKPKQQ